MILNLIPILCKKAAQKLKVINSISSLLDPEKKKLAFNAVTKSCFSYSWPIWMFNFQRSNNLINWICERSLKTVYNHTGSTFQELLQSNRSVSIHHKNNQTLTEEVLKVMNNIGPPIMKTFFDFRESKGLSDMVSKQVFNALLNYSLLFLWI